MESWEIALDFLQAVVVPVAVALTTVWLVHRYETKKLRIEQDEQIVRHLFDRYVSALIETYEAMSECCDTLNRFLNSPPNSASAFNKEVLSVREKWDITERKNALWLTKINSEISTVRGEFRLATTAIFNAIGKPSTAFTRWNEFSDACGSGAKALRGLIPISSLEERLGKLGEQHDLHRANTPKPEVAGHVPSSPEKHKDGSRIDRIFELCLLLVTVIAAAELQYASLIYSSKEELGQVNFFFRVSTIPIIIILVTTWIVIKLFPSIQNKIHALRRLVKEFCWTLFGNLFALEIIVFVYLGFSKELGPSMVWGQYGTLLSFLLTFPATWHYRRADQENERKTLGTRFFWITLLEHTVLYFVSYGLLRYIMLISGTIPIP